jgi:hypothetical protein
MACFTECAAHVLLQTIHILHAGHTLQVDDMMNRMIIYIFGMLCFISLISGIGSGVWSARMCLSVIVDVSKDCSLN